ncbi:FAD-dependent oxidoreductase [Veronia pacifica]|uniref:FAD-dependent oxidoreductase n=1 Tax=Veronia pacifica TaxID=1080227 RepID=UPI0036F3164B
MENTHPIGENSQADFRVGIVGGGIAGSTAALRLSALGVKTLLFEASDHLVSGPPICHLHAGGNLYREISEQQCLSLLEQSINLVRAYPTSVNRRPTVIAVPLGDEGEPTDILPRLNTLRQHYQSLVSNDARNNVLGNPDNYYRLYDREQMEALAQQTLPESPQSPDDWMIPVAKFMSLDKLKYPVVLVEEYGVSVFRLSSAVKIALASHTTCQVKVNHSVSDIVEDGAGWQIKTRDKQGRLNNHKVDFVINASGFRTGEVDNLVRASKNRLVEYKAAYVAHWPSQRGQWPEVIVHGKRGTPKGMAQLTPYPQGFFQLHGMTQSVTLFEGGLAQSTERDAQPRLPNNLISKVTEGWDNDELRVRTERAISHFAQWMPVFEEAEVGGKPLCGAQQIPGTDPSLRAADTSFIGNNYARMETVKASSALVAADKIVRHLNGLKLVELYDGWEDPANLSTSSLDAKEVVSIARGLATSRGYPDALAEPLPAF